MIVEDNRVGLVGLLLWFGMELCKALFLEKGPGR